MAIYSARRRSFPALIIVPLLFVFCLFPGQGWIAHLLPRFAGLATIDPGLNVLNTPIRLPVSIDLILVPALFLLLYVLIILTFAIKQHAPVTRNLTHRLGAVLSGTFFLLVCVAIGALISYVLLEQLPGRVQNSISAVGINADIHLPFLGYKTNSLHGNILSLLGLLIGIGVFVGKINSDPHSRRSIPLTREQRMTPYQRMLHERRNPPPFIPRETPPVLNARCHNEPLQSLEPEAVNYRPLA